MCNQKFTKLKFSKNGRKCSHELRTVFGEFQKTSEIFGKLLKSPVYITCPLMDTNFYLLVFNSISDSFAGLTREISS